MVCLRADGAEPKPCAAIARRRKQAIHLLLKRWTRTRGHCAAISTFRDGWVRRSRKSALIPSLHAANVDSRRSGPGRQSTELERAARQAEAVIARDPLLAGVEDAHAKQLAIVLVRERQEV